MIFGLFGISENVKRKKDIYLTNDINIFMIKRVIYLLFI